VISYNESAAKMHLSNLVAFIAINLSVQLQSDDLKLVFNVINSTLSVSCLQQMKELSELIKEVFIIIFLFYLLIVVSFMDLIFKIVRK
jgi:hypothetical protein